MMCPEYACGTTMSARSLFIEVAAVTARGRRRVNADAFLVDEAAGLLAVADAMGDNAHSSLMSRIALAMVREPFGAQWLLRPFAARFAGEAAERFQVGVARANRRAYEVGTTEPRCGGTTFAGVVVCGNHLCIAHVGDSRIYLLRSATGELVQVTEDHTVMNDLLSRGMSHESAARVQNADALTRALGARAAVEVRPSVAAWAPGDVALVCTDGLSDWVHAEAMLRVLTEATGAQQAAQRLVDAAGDVGGWDNATALVARNRLAELAVRGEG
jgi:PPM family protein phosphatase